MWRRNRAGATSSTAGIWVSLDTQQQTEKPRYHLICNDLHIVV